MAWECTNMSAESAVLARSGISRTNVKQCPRVRVGEILHGIQAQKISCNRCYMAQPEILSSAGYGGKVFWPLTEKIPI